MYFHASAPVRVSPLIETTFPFPTFLLAKVPLAPVEIRLTTSDPTTPTKTELPKFTTALVVPLYALLLAVIPVTVSPDKDIVAVAVGAPASDKV